MLQRRAEPELIMGRNLAHSRGPCADSFVVGYMFIHMVIRLMWLKPAFEWGRHEDEGKVRVQGIKRHSSVKKLLWEEF